MRRPPPQKVSHVSMDARRRRFSVREDAFARLWEHENYPRHRGDFGLLQMLMIDQRTQPGVHPALERSHCRAIIRNREAAIVATIIQWLGTNVGMCFLERALKMMGKRIVEIDPGREMWSSWVSTADRLPPKSGRYLVKQRHRPDYVSTSTSEADFIAGTVPGKKGLWTDWHGQTADIALWYEAETLHGNVWK